MATQLENGADGAPLGQSLGRTHDTQVRSEDGTGIADIIRNAGSSGQVQSLVRALGTLEVLADYPEGLTLTKLAEATGLARSTTHRLLTTMDAMQFVMFDAKRSLWRVGPRAFSVGSAFDGAGVIKRLSTPVAAALSMDCRETVNVVVMQDNSQIYVGQKVTPLPTPFRLREGDRLPAQYGAGGKSMLSYWEDAQLAEYLQACDFTRRTGKSNTDVGLLREKLKLAHERGYAFDCEENLNDLRCVGAPIFDHRGKPVAAISISAPLNRMPKDRMHSLGRAIKAASAKVTESINGIAPRHLN